MSSATTLTRKQTQVNTTRFNSIHGINADKHSATSRYVQGVNHRSNNRRPTSSRDGTRPTTAGSMKSTTGIRRPMSSNYRIRPSSALQKLTEGNKPQVRMTQHQPRSPTDKSTVTNRSNTSNQTASTKSGSTQSGSTPSHHTQQQSSSRRPKSRVGFFRRRTAEPRPEPRYDSDISSLDDEDDCNDPEEFNSTNTTSRTDREILQELTEFMTKEFPAEDSKTTSLHVACEKHCSDELILHHLLPTNPEAVHQENAAKELPLHSAMKDSKGVSERVFNKLLELNPNAAQQGSWEGHLPIHLLLEHHPSPPIFVLKKLLEVYPGSVLVQTGVAMPYSTDAQAYVTDRAETTREDDDTYLDDSTVLSEQSTQVNTGMCWGVFGGLFTSSTNENAVDTDLQNNGSEDETGFTLLHIAVLKGVKPEIVEYIVQTNPDCVSIKTSKGRTAKDCAKFKVAKAVQDDEQMTGDVKNTFAAIEMLQVFENNSKKRRRLERRMSKTVLSVKSFRGSQDVGVLGPVPEMTTEDEDEADHLQSSSLSSGSFDAKREWKKVGNAVKFINRFSFNKKSMLGPTVLEDGDTIITPSDLQLPPNLSYLCVDLELPVGFRRLRRALLSNFSNFMLVEFFQKKLKYKDVQIGSWDKFNDAIGGTAKNENEKQFLGAERKASYIMPKNGLVPANMAHESICLVEYNENCFAIKKVTRNPDVPYGGKFEAHVLMVFVNKGENTCQMTASVEARFFGKPPMIAWKIKNGMYTGVTDFFVALGECIRENVEAEVSNVVGSSRELSLPES